MNLQRLRTPATHALALAAAVALFLYWFPLGLSSSIDPASISHWGKNAYAAPTTAHLPTGVVAAILKVAPDSGNSPSDSRITLRENGAALGPAHSLHAEIGDKGGGRFSHWTDALIFSASDNSDPRANKRIYSIAYEVAPPVWLVLALLLATGAAFLRRGHVAASRPYVDALVARSAWWYWIGSVVLAIYLNVAFATLVAAPIPYPDSSGYLEWSLFRTLGYPLFLHTYHWIFGTWQYLHVYQLNLMVIGVVLLGFGVARVSRSYLAGWAVVALAASWANMLLTATDFLTEAPFAAFTMAHLAFVLLHFAGTRALCAWLAGIALAVAVLVKSVAVVLLGPAILLILFIGKGRRAALLPILLLPMVSWLGPGAYNYSRNGVFESSTVGGYALAGHIAWAIAPRPGSQYPVESGLIETRLRPILAKRPEFTSISQYIDYTANEYNTLLWANIVPELAQRYSDVCGPAVSGPCTWKACTGRCGFTVNKTLLKISRETIAADPIGFTRHVAAHFYGLWRDAFSAGGDFLHGASTRGGYLHAQYEGGDGYYRKMLAPVPAFPSDEQRAQATERIGNSAGKRLVDLITLRELGHDVGKAGYRVPAVPLGLAVIASFLVFTIARRPPSTQALCYVALCICAYFLGTALAQPSLNRYAWPMQGTIAALMVLAAWAALAWIIRRRRAAGAAPG